MAVKKILVADKATLAGNTESVLRTDFTPVKTFNDRLSMIIRDLKDTLHSDTLSVGLAAPQIGYPEAVAVVNLNKKEEGSEDLVIVNPRVVDEAGQKDVKFESCMSIPHKRGQVERRKKIKIMYSDEAGRECELEASSFFARVLMHEIDHLNGVLFVDRMEEGQELEETEMFREHGIS